MDPTEIKGVLKAIGIGSGVVLLITAVGVGVFAYRSYLETIKLKLEISLLKNELNSSQS